MNITDIDDKIIKRANKENITIKELTSKYINAFYEDIDKLNIKRADKYPKATEHISNMIEMIKELINKGYAYEKEGDVYFSVESFKDYGKLSNKNLEDLVSGARVEVNDKKENPVDFTLWKKSKENEPAWDSPWGKGRPGWHIECSVMSTKYLGEKFDIHTGGVDLTFPHHENEIAQSEECCGHQVVNYWVHNGYINIDGEKMSKSLGNFFTIKEILDKYDSEIVRFFLVSKHYRSPIDFSEFNLNEAKKSYERLNNVVFELDRLIKKEIINEANNEKEIIKQINKIYNYKKKKFINAMDDDFNTALAIGILHELTTEINKIINGTNFILTGKVKEKLIKVKNIYIEFGDILGLNFNLKVNNQANVEDKLYQIIDKFNLNINNFKKIKLEDLIDLILEKRNLLRKNKKYQLADGIRNDLNEIGIEVKDNNNGIIWSLK